MTAVIAPPLTLGPLVRSSVLTDTTAAAVAAPVLPPGREVNLPGRGSTFVREIAGPPDAPVVMLLHGWSATADLNWHRSYAALGRHHRVIALDHRGHGRGLRTQRRFRLEDCADDAVALADALGIERFIPVGYSMGGPIASLIWHRHRSRVSGLVLCATSRHFNATPSRRALFTLLNGISAAASLSPMRAIGAFSGRMWSQRLARRGDEAWTIEQVLRHDWTEVLNAGRAIGRFDSSSWIGDVEVPAAVVATLDDDVVPTCHQLELADSINGATVHPVVGGHTACNGEPARFVEALLDACRSVTLSASH